ncbi:prephenate dehydrogenase [Chloroflexota bacterium]
MRISIIGLGLIGGSLGLALKQRHGQELELTGWARRQEVALEAINKGAVDKVEPELAEAVRHSQLVFLCTPVRTIEGLLQAIAQHLPSDCVVTDTASTKHQIMKWAENSLCPSHAFIGGHPMAGKETFGIEVAEADLFEGCTYCLTPAAWTTQNDIDRVVEVVNWLGAKPLFIEASEHDYLVAGISHLPILLSAATVAITTNHPNWPLMSKLASTGYRDITRLASGNPSINIDIFHTNQEAILHWIDELMNRLSRMREQIAETDEGLKLTLSKVSDARQRWLETKHD